MKRIWCSLIILFFSLSLEAQLTVVPDDFSLIKLESGVLFLEDTTTQLTPDEAYFKFSNGDFVDANGFLNFGFSKSAIWLAIPLKKSGKKDLDAILEIANHSIDFVDFFRLDGQSLTLLEQSGDFVPRKDWKTQFATPSTKVYLYPGDSAVFFVRAFKPTGAMSLPVYVWYRPERVLNAQRGNLYTGIFSGITLLLSLYTLLLFYQFKQSIYIFYSLYILSMTVYLWAGTGFTEFWFWPQNILIQNSITAIASALVFIFLSLFSYKYLNLIAKSFHGAFLISAVVFVALLLIANMFFPAYFSNNSQLFLNVFYVVVVFQQLNLFTAAFRKYKEDKRYYGFFIIAYSIPYLAVLSKLLIEFGVLPDFSRTMNPMLFGFIIDVILFAFALTYQLRNMYLDRQLLLEKQVLVAKELVSARVTGEETEKKRIAQELHDDVGFKLSSLKQELEQKITDPSIFSKLSEVISHTREITHNLYPGSLKFLGIKRAIVNLVNEIKTTASFKIDLEFYDFPDRLTPSHELHLYRIVQEGLNNILKYADCTQVNVDFFTHDSGHVITIEDNGVGFDKSVVGEGIGLQSIRSRVEMLGGKFEIDTQKGRGTVLIIELPLVNNTDQNIDDH